MPNFPSAIRTNKLPVIGLTPEQSGTAPTSPVDGQLWTNTTSHIVQQWDAGLGAWVPWLRLGTTAGTAAAGNDGRITGALQAANNLSDLAAAGTARTNLGLGTAAVANTGVGAGNVILGNDARLSDQRTPTDASVTGGTAGAGVKIAANTITLANLNASTVDQAAATGSLRTLSLTATTSALPGGTSLAALAAANASTGPITASNQEITNLGAPLSPNSAARLSDITAAQAGIDSKPSVRVLSTAQRALTGLAAIDGVTPVAGDRVLLSGQTTATENGVYIAAAGAWARAADTINPNSLWFVEEGTANHDTSWWVTNDGAVTVGTTALVISQFAAPTAYTQGTGITISANTISISATYAGQATITTLGTITTGVWNATTIGLAYGGLGVDASTAGGKATARTNLGVAQAGYAATLGAVTAGAPLVVTHNLGTQDVIAQVRDASTNEILLLDVINASTTTVTVTSGVAYAANALRIVVLPVV
jgi:hypothetical protein